MPQYNKAHWHCLMQLPTYLISFKFFITFPFLYFTNMENPSPSNHSIHLPKTKPKLNLSKLLIQRKTHNPIFNHQQPIIQPDKQDNLILLQLERQNPIAFLETIQSTHQQIQKNLDQSFITSSKWRSYNSPISTPKHSHSEKQNLLFQPLYTKRKQLSAIKVYNHVNNQKDIPTKNFEEPQFLQFIQEAVSKSTRKPNFQTATQTPTGSTGPNTKRTSKIKRLVDIKQNYTVGDHRKQLQNLQTWIKSKLQTFEQQQTSGQSMFADRINFMNMAFCEVSRVAGTFSTETKQIIEYLHKKYYDYYNFLTECLIEQNKKIKAEISQVEDRLLKTINYYEDKLTKFKKESEEKAQKIVINFQKCIEMKKKLEKQNKEYKHNLSNEQKKSKLVEQALIKVITLFLALGQKNIQEMTFSLQSFSQNNDYIKTSMLAKSTKKILTEEEMQAERRKMIFQEWCGYLIKMVHRILIKDICQKQGSDMRSTVFKKQAFEVIKQYMTQNDESISPADAQNILNKFLSTQEEEFKIRKDLDKATSAQKQAKEKDLMDLERLNKKFENMYSDVVYKLPTFEQVYNRLNVNDVDVQVNIRKEIDCSAVQTQIETQEIGIMALPRTKTREVDVSSEMRQKINLQSNTISFCEVLKIIKQKATQQQNQKENIKKRIKKIQQNGYRIKTNETMNSEERIGMVNMPDNGIISFENLSKNRQNTYLSDKAKIINPLRSDNSIHQLTLINAQQNPFGGKFKQIGINTMISRCNHNRTVQFNLSNYEDQQNNQLNMQQSENDQKNQQQLKSNSSNHFDSRTSLVDSIRQSDNEFTTKEGFSRKGKPKRKNGFLITGNAEKTHLSQKFICSTSSLSEQSDQSLSSDSQNDDGFLQMNKKSSNISAVNQKTSNHLQQKIRETFLTKRQQHCSSQNLDQNLRSSMQNIFSKTLPQTKLKRNQTLQERVIANRSYFKLSNIEYASKQDADSNQIKDQVIRVPKRKTLKQKYAIDPHDFHIELAFKNSQKVKFMTSITLWPSKLMLEMKKIRQRVKVIKPLIEIDNKAMHLIKGYMGNIVNPILKQLLKSYCQLMKNDRFDFGDMSLSSSSKGFKSSGSLAKFLGSSSTAVNKETKNVSSQLSYHQRLSPLLYNIINYTQYHLNRTSSDNEVFFSGLKTLKYKSSKMEVYHMLIEGKCVEVDIFVKTIYQFSLFISNNNNYNPVINYFVIQLGLFEALQNYFSDQEIQKIILQTKKFILSAHANSNRRRSLFKNQNHRDSVKTVPTKKLDTNAICYHELLVIIFRHLKQKQNNQEKKYSIIKDVISRNSQCTAYQDIMHFLQCLPIQNDKRKKILGDCLKHVVYWNSNEASVPNDIFYFILDKYELYNSSANNSQSTDVIKEYIVNRCELYFKGTLFKVIKNPDWALNSTYILSYKIPKIFHRVFYQIKTGRNFRQKKLLNCLLTLIFCNLIDIQMEKKYMPALLNGLIAVPYT